MSVTQQKKWGIQVGSTDILGTYVLNIRIKLKYNGCA